MPGKNFFNRLSAEIGMRADKKPQPNVVVAIYHNIVKDYRLETDPKIKYWKKQLLQAGFNVATVPLEQAKILLGKRFQERSYYGEEESSPSDTA